MQAKKSIAQVQSNDTFATAFKITNSHTNISLKSKIKIGSYNILKAFGKFHLLLIQSW